MDTNIDASKLESSVEASVHTLLKNGWQAALMTILFAVILLVVCLIVKAIVLKILDRALDRFKQIEKSLHTFIRSMVNIILWFITLMIVAESLGINASSLLALVSIFGLAISLSVKDSLANLAGGFTILSTRPFKVGDYVEIGSTGGTIREIGMVYTKLATLDNRIILMPNNVVVDAEVTNYSAEDLRRVDLVVTAAYDAPVEQVKRTIAGVVDRHELTLSDPAPFIRLLRYGDSALEYAVRVWCANSDYWTVYHDLLEQIKEAFDAQRISIPYPQMEVTVRKSFPEVKEHA